jgi:hypothetical protein
VECRNTMEEDIQISVSAECRSRPSLEGWMVTGCICPAHPNSHVGTFCGVDIDVSTGRRWDPCAQTLWSYLAHLRCVDY